MKTIIITSFHPLISRNILSTPILDLLLGQGGIRLVLLVPEQKKIFFDDEFRRPGVEIEGIHAKLTRRGAIFRHLSLAWLNTRSLDIKRRTELGHGGAWLARCIGNNPLWRSVIRLSDRALLFHERFEQLFIRYRPDLIFATDVQNENDVRLIHEARRRGVKTVGMVRSWDNLTAKGLIRVIPDILLVHNQIVKGEAMRYHGVPEDRIQMVAIPHYDRYLGENRCGREEFFKRIHGDPRKKLILFAPIGDRYLGGDSVDRDIIEIIRDVMPANCQMLVRLPPTDTVNLGSLMGDGRIIFERPTTHGFSSRNTELTLEADRHLADTLFHSDLVISGPSSISIDGALFDKPVILIGFDGYQSRPYYESVRRYYDYNHWQPIFHADGVRLVKSEEALKEWMKRYLEDPRRDAEGRRRIAEEQCLRLNGRSSQRVADILSQYL